MYVCIYVSTYLLMVVCMNVGVRVHVDMFGYVYTCIHAIM